MANFPPGLRRPPPPKGRVLGDLEPEQPVRPLMDRWRDGPPNDGGRTRLIGLEVRLRDPFGCQEEVKMIPLDIEIRGTSNATLQFEFGPCTLHTSVGDVNIPAVRIPASGF